MPSKKKKYNARFPAGRIKKIMQSDEEIGKVAQAVPVIISRTLELFVESLLTKTLKITNSRNAKTLSPSHMKQCIMSENRFDFLRELVKCIPDISVAEEVSYESSPEATIDHSDTPYDLSMPSTSNNIETSIQAPMSSKGNVSIIINNDVNKSSSATHTVSQLESETLNYGGSDNSENHSKCDFLNSKIDHQEAKSGHLSICSRSVSTECTPQLFADTHSVPAGTQSPQVKTNALSPQQHQQLQATDLRRIRHQTKFESESTNICNDTVMFQKSNAKPQTPTAMIRAPIVSIDFCNKPVVKIDYSNLALHDTNYSVAAPLSSSSPTLEQINKIPLNDDKAHISLSAINPVINIDLSNIVTCEALSSSKLYSSIVKPSCAEVSVTPTLPPASTTYKTTCFELDEDYDNI